MSKTSKIIITVIIVATLLLGVGYAAIQSVTLNIAGTAVADPSQANFKVMFTGTPVVSDENYVTAGITDDTNATINVSGLTKKGEIVTATYTVQNVSDDLSADLSVATTNNNTEFFTLKSQLANGKTSLVAGEATTLTVTVELTKTPLAESVSSTIGVQLTATPVQPGEEGISGATNDYSQTPEPPTLSLVTNDNIGDYIDLGNNIIGTENSTDDWRIFYKDDGRVYAILADYLPSKQVPASAGLTIDTAEPQTKPYNVWSDTDRDTLLNGLLNTTAWNSFTNGIEGAIATGSPTLELLMNSYNAKKGTEIVFGLGVNLDISTEDNALYMPLQRDNCYGYWMASPIDSDRVYYLYFNGIVNAGNYDRDIGASRPIVSLPTSTIAELVDGVWTVTK